jgi:hypothetical protein
LIRRSGGLPASLVVNGIAPDGKQHTALSVGVKIKRSKPAGA